MYLPVKVGILSLSASLWFSAVTYADQSAVTHIISIPEPIIVPPAGKVALIDVLWNRAATKNFHSSHNKVTLTLDTPEQYKRVKFEMSKPLRLISADIYGSDNKRMTLAYQSPVSITDSVEKAVPPSFGPITKVTVIYKNPKNSEGVISLLRRDNYTQGNSRCRI